LEPHEAEGGDGTNEKKDNNRTEKGESIIEE